MADSTVSSVRPKDGKKKDKKRKRENGASTGDAVKQGAGFLLGSNKDAELDDIFGKSSALAPTLPPAQKSSGTGSGAGPNTDDISVEKKVKKGKSKSKDVSTVSALPVVALSASSAEAGPSTIRAAQSTAPPADDVADSDSDSEAGEEDLQHETLSTPKKTKQKRSDTLYIPPDESSADRDRRSLFLGNLPISVAKSKSDLSQLKAHLLTYALGAKIESVRFRSVAFAAPTAALPADEEEGEGGDKKRQKREQERAKKWKEQQDALQAGGKEAEEVDPSKSYLDQKGKRKVAFIKKEFHEGSTSCNGYIVFAHPHPDRPSNVAPILDPYIAAEQVLAANGSNFQNRTIRVDRLRLPSAQGLQSATTALSKRDAWLPAGTDPRRSLFVGGLDYAAKEEDVRVFFEELVKAERGEREGGGRWVTEVRVIRDRETQLGKGFGYVHFVDRESADEIVALPSSKLKFAKKPLRVQTSKTLPPSVTRAKPTGFGSGSAPGGSSSTALANSTGGMKAKAPRPVGPIKVPKGDPALGDKLKSMSKEERKLAKAADTDRAARRLAKKQAKVAIGKGGVETGAVRLGPTKAERRDKAGSAGKAKKSRVRSSNALAKMKGSRD